MARDFRVRWALEEAGLPYEVMLVDPQVQASASYRRWQPFGQVPAYRDDQVEMFESGAIVLHIAERFPGLLPTDADARARAVQLPAWNEALGLPLPAPQRLQRAEGAGIDLGGRGFVDTVAGDQHIGVADALLALDPLLADPASAAVLCDLDGTLAESKQPLQEPMGEALVRLTAPIVFHSAWSLLISSAV